MDTQTLHDLLIDDGFNLKSYEANEWEDAAGVWLDHAMQNPEWMMDFWLDSLAELHAPEKAEQLNIFLGYVSRLHEKTNDIQSFTNPKHRGLSLSFAHSANLQAALLGGEVYRAIREGMEKYINKMAQEWFSDVLGYACDMERGQREDYEYENYRDRMMEERA